MPPGKPRADAPKRPALALDTGQSSYLSEAEAAAGNAAIDTVVRALGGRERLTDTLAVAADAPEVEQILVLLLDPRYSHLSIRGLCRLAGLSVVDLFTAYKKAMVVKAHLAAYQAISDGILPVVEDVMKRAAPFAIPCDRCGATGETRETADAAPVVCGACNGQKQVLQLPDLDRQKLALELAQLVQKSAGISISQNTAVAPAAEPETHSTMIELQQAVRQLLSGPRQPIVDAETLPKEE